MFKITKRMEISAAHFLPLMPDGHKCKNLHGHNWKVEVEISAHTLPESGMLMDFGLIKSEVMTLDHSSLNRLIPNPTAENIAEFIARRLDNLLMGSYPHSITAPGWKRNGMGPKPIWVSMVRVIESEGNEACYTA